MFTEIRKISSSNRQEVIQLKVAASQQNFIETVEESLADAEQDARFVPIGLYHGDTLVGFAMYGAFGNGQERRVWFDRFFIDARHQRKGYGAYYFKLILLYLKETYQCNDIYLSVYSTNTVAINMYTKLGFHFNGELDINGEQVMVTHL